MSSVGYLTDEMHACSYPGPTLRALELLQQEHFRKDAVTPALIEAMAREGFEAATSGTTGI